MFEELRKMLLWFKENGIVTVEDYAEGVFLYLGRDIKNTTLWMTNKDLSGNIWRDAEHNYLLVKKAVECLKSKCEYVLDIDKIVGNADRLAFDITKTKAVAITAGDSNMRIEIGDIIGKVDDITVVNKMRLVVAVYKRKTGWHVYFGNEGSIEVLKLVLARLMFA